MTVLSKSRKRAVLGGIALLGTTALLLSGCSSAAAPINVGELKLGSLLPETGSLAFLAPPMEGGIALAVKDVNDANAGITITLTQADEGDTDTKAYETSIERLRGDGITALIGAAASGVTSLIVEGNVNAGILQVSPSSTAPSLTNLDDNGMFYRTAPSDELQGEILGNVIAEDGHKTLGFIWQNDPYGEGLFNSISATFEASGGTVVADASYNVGDATFNTQVNAVLAQNPDAVVVVSFDQFRTIAPLLINGGIEPTQLYMMDGNTANYGSSADGDLSVSIEGAKGTRSAPVDETAAADFLKRVSDNWVSLGNEPVTEATYAYESYDAVIIIALASMAAKSTKGADIAAKMQEVSGGTGGGEKCTTFKACADLLNAGKTIDYDGQSGGLAFDENGDPTESLIGVFQYGADNNYSRIG
jgi:branched-chain amino acid transport system substrate-binding protein